MAYKTGDTLLNKYRIERLLGRGGFAEVYLATHLELDVPRALKVLRKDAPGLGSRDLEDFNKRFQLEAQLGAMFDHPNLVRVYDFERDADTLILVMEYCPGGSLADRLKELKRKNENLELAKALQIGMDAARGLAALHQKDIVHRDLKPSNILFDSQGRAKVSDLGLAQIPADLSQRGLLGDLAPNQPGTFLYMSPEQKKTTDPLRPSSDVYTLGVVLFEALTGRNYNNLKPGTRLRNMRQHIPYRLDNLLAKMLHLDPEKRPQDGKEVLRLLQNTGNKNLILWIGLALAGLVFLRLVILPFLPVSTPLQPVGAVRTTDLAVSPATVATDTALPTISLPATATHTLRPKTTATRTLRPTVVPTSTENPKFPPARAILGDTWTSRVDGMELVYIPAGDFQMGCDSAHNGGYECESYELPLHTVTLDAYWMDKTEVSNAQYAQCVATRACDQPSLYSSITRDQYYNNLEYADYPVVYVSWYDAEKYCTWAGRRLPTEAESEKAARGESPQAYPWGVASTTCDLVNGEVGGKMCEGDTSAVGSYPDGASPYGVLDMAGNVWEWVYDWYSSTYYGSQSNFINPTGPSSGELRVVRGGSFGNYSPGLLTANRGSNFPGNRLYYLGFRCASP